MSVGGAVVSKLGVAETEMAFLRVILGGGQLAMELVGAHIGRVLVADAVLVKSLVSNRQSEFTWLGSWFPHGESIFADKILGFKTDKLHDDAGFAHGLLKTLPIAATRVRLVRRPIRKKRRATRRSVWPAVLTRG